MAAAGISRRTLTDWINTGLLPRPVKVSQGFPRGVFNRFDASAVTQARFVAAKRLEGLTIDEIVNILANGTPPAPTASSPDLASPARIRR